METVGRVRAFSCFRVLEPLYNLNGGGGGSCSTRCEGFAECGVEGLRTNVGA